MAKLRSFHFSRARSLESVERYLNDALEEGVLWHRSRTSLGRSVDMSGRDLLNFGSCSYLGLHLRRELKEGAAAAIERYGTQFSISRVFQSCDLYAELEASLCEMTGGHVLVTPTTTLAHQAALDQRRTYRRRRIGFTCRNQQLDKADDFLCHDENLC